MRCSLSQARRERLLPHADATDKAVRGQLEARCKERVPAKRLRALAALLDATLASCCVDASLAPLSRCLVDFVLPKVRNESSENLVLFFGELSAKHQGPAGLRRARPLPRASSPRCSGSARAAVWRRTRCRCPPPRTRRPRRR